MLGLAIGFFLAAIVAAIFGFGVVATTFAGLAQLLFYVFLVLLVVSLVLHLIGASGHSGIANGAGLLVVGALVAVATYAWFDNGMSAERLGRAIDHGASQLSADAGDAVDTAGTRARALASSTGDSVRHDAARLLENDRDKHREARDAP